MNIGNVPMVVKRGFNSGLIVGFFMLILLIMADYIYGSYAAIVKPILYMYFFLYLFAIVTTGLKPPTVYQKPASLMMFVIGFIVTTVFLSIVGTFTSLLTVQGAFEIVTLAIGFGLLHGFVKAYVEEITFRGVFLQKLGWLPANVLFGLFHFGVLAMNPAVGLGLQMIAPLAILISLGLIWTWMATKPQLGIMAATGSHFAWNMVQLGVNVFKS